MHAEHQPIREPPVPPENVQRLPAAFPRLLVGRGHHAPVADAHHAERQRADPDPPAEPAVLGPRRRAGDHEVGPEAGDRDGLVAGFQQPAVERVQRGQVRQQQRMPVGEGHRPLQRIVQVDQPHLAAEGLGQPGVRLGAGRRRRERKAEKPHRYRIAAARCGQREVGQSGGTHNEAPVLDGGQDASQPGLLPLGHRPPVRVDDHPAPVTSETPGFDRRRGRVDPVATLDRVRPDGDQPHGAYPLCAWDTITRTSIITRLHHGPG